LKAIELDPHFAEAYGMAAFCYVLRKQSRWTTDEASEVAEAARLARKALQLGTDNALALTRAGHALAYVVGEINAGKLFVERALALNPNMATAWLSSGWISVWLGEPDMAVKYFANFKRLSPLDRLMPMAQSGNAFAHFFAGRYDDALSQAEQTLQENPNLHPALRIAAATNALAGRTAEAQKLVVRLSQIDPALHVSNLMKLTPLRRPEDIARYTEGMRKAGLPD
jgi:adenylate cyclase